MTKLLVRRLYDDAIAPTYTYESDSGLDLYSTIDLEIQPSCWQTVSTGICLQLPEGCEGQIRPRSGLAAKFGVTVLNAPGTVDNGHRGEILVILINHGNHTFFVKKGMRVAQLVVTARVKVYVQEVAVLSDSDRGDSAIGSSD